MSSPTKSRTSTASQAVTYLGAGLMVLGPPYWTSRPSQSKSSLERVESRAFFLLHREINLCHRKYFRIKINKLCVFYNLYQWNYSNKTSLDKCFMSGGRGGVRGIEMIHCQCKLVQIGVARTRRTIRLFTPNIGLLNVRVASDYYSRQNVRCDQLNNTSDTDSK